MSKGKIVQTGGATVVEATAEVPMRVGDTCDQCGNSPSVATVYHRAVDVLDIEGIELSGRWVEKGEVQGEEYCLACFVATFDRQDA